MKILVTGGTGFIGSHTVVELLSQNHEVVIIDNLCNSSETVIKNIEKISGKKIPFFNVDIRNKKDLEELCSKYKFDCCIHFAGLKAVGESCQKPLEYYDNNINGTLSLLEILNKYNCHNLIFSSSATVYGNPKSNPIDETFPKGTCTNPYGWTKSMIEQILIDLQKAIPDWNIVLLRYFNPIGAHKSGLIGENPNGIPNNLMPYITQVSVGKRKELNVFGNDYDTPDGTGVRDYIHVVDLAKGHVKALKVIEEKQGLKIYNLGTGQGYSVMQVLKTFEKVNNVKIPYQIKPRRAGDIAACYANPQKAFKELSWKAEYSLEDMCRDSYNWEIHKKN